MSSNDYTIEIPTRFTEQHIIATVIKPYILEAEDMIGKEKVRTILHKIGVPLEYFEKQSNWLSVGFLDEFVDEFSKFGDIAELNRRSGERSLSPEIIGLKHYFLKHFVTPSLAFRSVEKILKNFNLTRTYKLIDCSDDRARISIGLTDRKLLPKHRESCLNWKANFETYLQIMTGKGGKVQKTSCSYDGDEACIYDISWKNKKNYLSFVIISLLGTALISGLLAVLAQRQFSAHFLTGIGASFVLSLMAYLFLRLAEKKKDRTALSNQFDRFEQESSERYLALQDAKAELERKYLELGLLEETASQIQKSSEVSAILKVSLSSVCNAFHFDRAFAMLVDAERKNLTTTSVAGIKQDALQDLWKYSVDVSEKRENPLLLSSVYHSGEPVFISDVDAHLFQLNERSQALVKRMNTKGFAIVPIPSGNHNWGVLVADKGSVPNKLTRSDLAVLQRVAQHLGIALDKQAKLDEEARLRSIFQKYAPPQILEQAQQSDHLLLGGQVREIICLFLDIRNFTAISSRLPAQVVVGLLNRVFSLVHSVVTESNGWIDKFLGDGVFVTWGALGNSKAETEASVTAGINIILRLKELNRDLVVEGLPEIHVGMGMHRGAAVVGNLGTDQRMEFSSIGSTVNLASRLENCCKQFGTSIVLSKSLFAELSEDLKRNFRLQEKVLVRGWQEEITIALLRNEVVGQDILSREAA